MVTKASRVNTWLNQEMVFGSNILFYTTLHTGAEAANKPPIIIIVMITTNIYSH